jgi:aryl-alcohol dehydrogenase-like predicted oxidoreductase
MWRGDILRGADGLFLTWSAQWDTANVYSNGESERIMAEAMREYKIPRRKLVLMTKCYRVVCDEEAFDAGSGVTMHQDLALQSKDYMNQSGEARLPS